MTSKYSSRIQLQLINQQNDYQKQHMKELNTIVTGNEIVNQVINLKYATAHKYQIPMDIQIVLPPHLSIPDHHLCSLVANLLDNAIEASRKIEDPKIVIEMKMVKDYLSLTIRNKMDPSMQDKALTIRTTKADKKQHGLGRQIIDDIVRRYNGCVRFL